MIPRLKPTLGWDEFRSLFNMTGGDDVGEFEKAFAELASQNHAVAFPYGRTALLAILRALDLSDSEIICPSYTCVVVPHAVVMSGNRPVFIDPDPADMNMNLEQTLEAVTPRTGAIVATSLFGHPLNLDLLDRIRDRYPDLPIIQDCAHSFFCTWQKAPVHRSGLCAFYGLNISKIMTSIFGGMITTDDGEFAKRLLRVRESMLGAPGIAKSVSRMLYLLAVYVAFSRPVYGVVNALERNGFLDRFVKYYDPGVIDMPPDYLDEMTRLEGRVGTVQCRRYPRIVSHRRRLAEIYHEGLKDYGDIQLPPLDPGATYSHYAIRMADAEKIRTYFLRHGIQLGGIVDYYIPDMETYRDSRVMGDSAASKLPDTVLNLPVHTGVTEADARKVITLLDSYLQSGNRVRA